MACVCVCGTPQCYIVLRYAEAEVGEEQEKKRRVLRCGDARCQGLQPIGPWIYRRRTLIVSERLVVTWPGAFLLVLAPVVMAAVVCILWNDMLPGGTVAASI